MYKKVIKLHYQDFLSNTILNMACFRHISINTWFVRTTKKNHIHASYTKKVVP